MLYKHTVTARTLESWQSEQMRQIKGKGLRQRWLAQGHITSKWQECPFTAVAIASFHAFYSKKRQSKGLCRWKEANKKSVLLWADRLVGLWFPHYLFSKAMPEHSWQVLEEPCPLSFTHNRYIRSDMKHDSLLLPWDAPFCFWALWLGELLGIFPE